jgi:hypothetical protein
MGAMEKLLRSHNLLYQAVPHMSLASVKKVQAMEMINDFHFQSVAFSSSNLRPGCSVLGLFWTRFEINKIQKVHNFFLRNFWIFFFSKYLKTLFIIGALVDCTVSSLVD